MKQNWRAGAGATTKGAGVNCWKVPEPISVTAHSCFALLASGWISSCQCGETLNASMERNAAQTQPAMARRISGDGNSRCIGSRFSARPPFCKVFSLKGNGLGPRKSMTYKIRETTLTGLFFLPEGSASQAPSASRRALARGQSNPGSIRSAIALAKAKATLTGFEPVLPP
jgi:hypothetical protein